MQKYNAHLNTAPAEKLGRRLQHGTWTERWHELCCLAFARGSGLSLSKLGETFWVDAASGPQMSWSLHQYDDHKLLIRAMVSHLCSLHWTKSRMVGKACEPAFPYPIRWGKNAVQAYRYKYMHTIRCICIGIDVSLCIYMCDYVCIWHAHGFTWS